MNDEIETQEYRNELRGDSPSFEAVNSEGTSPSFEAVTTQRGQSLF